MCNILSVNVYVLLWNGGGNDEKRGIKKTVQQ